MNIKTPGFSVSRGKVGMSKISENLEESWKVISLSMGEGTYILSVS